MECEFCNREFTPRPQVKHPRACFESSCQDARQRTNEKDWRNRQDEGGPDSYDSLQRSVRMAGIKEIVAEILKCLNVGRRMYKMSNFSPEAADLFVQIFLKLGIRKTNKFWTA